MSINYDKPSGDFTVDLVPVDPEKGSRISFVVYAHFGNVKERIIQGVCRRIEGPIKWFKVMAKNEISVRAMIPVHDWTSSIYIDSSDHSINNSGWFKDLMDVCDNYNVTVEGVDRIPYKIVVTDVESEPGDDVLDTDLDSTCFGKNANNAKTRIRRSF